MSLLLLASGLSGCGSGVATPIATTPAPPVATVVPPIWVGAWGASPTNGVATPDNGGGADQTFRFLMYPTIDGTQERVKFSNYFGSGPITVGAARLSVGTAGSNAVSSSQNLQVLFSGQPTVTIQPGTSVISDSVNVTFNQGQVLVVSMYLKGSFGQLNRHDALLVDNYATAAGAGDKTNDTAGTSFTTKVDDWLVVSEIDVYGPYQGTIAMFGSSTTDGFKSNYSSTQVYPAPNTPVAGQDNNRVSDWLARRLLSLGYRIGVINAGIPGDTITDTPQNTPNDTPTANQRVAHDVLAIPNLLAMISYFGSIDLRSSSCKSALEIEAATQQLITTAVTAKIPVVLATLPPSAFCTNPAQSNYGPIPTASDPYAGGLTPGPPNGGEAQRAVYNQWLRRTAATLQGVAGIADYDKQLADPQHPGFMLPQFNSGDNYHANGLGYKAEADALPLTMLPAPGK